MPNRELDDPECTLAEFAMAMWPCRQCGKHRGAHLNSHGRLHCVDAMTGTASPWRYTPRELHELLPKPVTSWVAGD
jgi:hypothetical protein